MSKPCPIQGIAISQDCVECKNRLCKKPNKKIKQIVIGIDQSYQCCGISVIVDGKIKKIDSLDLSFTDNKTLKRLALQERLEQILFKLQNRGNIICIIERIRQFSKGFINMNYIKGIGALNSVIVDTCYKQNVPVYSVDTRAWKASVIGTSKPKENNWNTPPEKWPMIEWLIKKGYEKDLLIEVTNTRKTKFVFEKYGKRWTYNNDAADSVGIGLFWFIGDKDKLLKEG